MELGFYELRRWCSEHREKDKLMNLRNTKPSVKDGWGQSYDWECFSWNKMDFLFKNHWNHEKRVWRYFKGKSERFSQLPFWKTMFHLTNITILNKQVYWWKIDLKTRSMSLTCNESGSESNKKKLLWEFKVMMYSRQLSNLVELDQFAFKECNNMPR